jgi:hypothetical protein
MPSLLSIEIRDVARHALAGDDLRATASMLDALAIDEAGSFALLRGVTEARETLDPIERVCDRLQSPPPPGALERVLLLRAWLANVPRIDDLPIVDAVKRLMAEEVRMVAARPATERRFDFRRNLFVSLSKLATLRRFPAGQLHWEVSGFPRSWLPKVHPRALPKLAYYLAIEMRGVAPTFVIHLNANRKDRAALLERESSRSFFRIAQSAALQPAIKGLVASSWLHSPDTMRVSPHLTALNRVFLENGAIVTTMGPADLESGVFTRSPERRRLYERGEFTPTTGLVVWPRRHMLVWAAAHPELAD